MGNSLSVNVGNIKSVLTVDKYPMLYEKDYDDCTVKRGQCLNVTMDVDAAKFGSIAEPVTFDYGINYALESVGIDGDGRIMQERNGDSVHYNYDFYLKDHLGSTRMVINDEQHVTERVNYQAYGSIEPLDSTSSPLPARDKFTGKEYDVQGADFARFEYDIEVSDFDWSRRPGAVGGLHVWYKDIVSGNGYRKIYFIRLDSLSRTAIFTGSESFISSTKITQMVLMAGHISYSIYNSATVDSFTVNPGTTRRVQLRATSYELYSNADSSFYTINSPEDNTTYFSGTKLFYFGARYYDPEIGVWLSVDPAKQFSNSYLYCHTNPIMYLDKDGRFDTFMHFLLGRFGNPLAGIIPGYDNARGLMHALPDIYNNLEETSPRLAKLFGLKEGSRRENLGSEAHGFTQGNYHSTLDFWKKERPYGISRFEWTGAKWHVAQDYWEGKAGMSLSQTLVHAFGGSSALLEYQDHIHGCIFAGALLLGPVVPFLSELAIHDYISGVINLGVVSAFTYASFEYDKKYGEGAFKQNMKEESAHTAIEAAAIPAAVAIDPTAATVGLVVSIVKRIQRWFK